VEAPAGTPTADRFLCDCASTMPARLGSRRRFGSHGPDLSWIALRAPEGRDLRQSLGTGHTPFSRLLGPGIRGNSAQGRGWWHNSPVPLHVAVGPPRVDRKP